MDSAVVGAIIASAIGFVATLVGVVIANRHGRAVLREERENLNRTRFHDLRVDKYQKFLVLLNSEFHDFALRGFPASDAEWLTDAAVLLSEIELLGSREVSQLAGSLVSTLHSLDTGLAARVSSQHVENQVMAFLERCQHLRSAMRAELGIEKDPRLGSPELH